MHPRTIAYFSMEIALKASMPTYSGGLGVLAGDHIRAAADARLPIVAVTLLHSGGHFRQTLDDDGQQLEARVQWNPEEYLQRLPERVSLVLEGRRVEVGAWRFMVAGVKPEDNGAHAESAVWSGASPARRKGDVVQGGDEAPVILLDTNLPENAEEDRTITDRLYLGDQQHRLKQEAVLGIAGVRMLEALGYDAATYHMNEGHASLLTLELLRTEAARQGVAPTEPKVLEAVRRRCVFTTHTPVEAGHDRFPLTMVQAVLEPELIDPFRNAEQVKIVAPQRTLNMTYLGFNLSKYINGVSLPHGRVSRAMFQGWTIESITNGVHAETWVAPPMAAVLDRHVRGWRQDNLSLRNALAVPPEEIRDAHRKSKQALCDAINKATGGGFDPDRFTIGFARRATAYKRPDLLLADPKRLREIARKHGPIQVVYSGKAHPYDKDGAALIQRIVLGLRELAPDVKGVYLPGYDMALCGKMIAGVDLWLNTPLPPLEASGTSGMKAALNGAPSLSTHDGWWVEGWIEGVTGWVVGDLLPDAASAGPSAPSAPSEAALADRRASDAMSIYDKLDEQILPLFHGDPAGWMQVMRHAVSLNGSFFNAQRMVAEYTMKAYFR